MDNWQVTFLRDRTSKHKDWNWVQMNFEGDGSSVCRKCFDLYIDRVKLFILINLHIAGFFQLRPDSIYVIRHSQ